MARQSGSKGPKKQTSITVEQSFYDWVEERMGPGREFSSFSHAVERGIACLREREKRVEEALEQLDD